MSSLTLPVMAVSRHRMATDGVGVTTLVVSRGCPLQCRYCINPFTWDPSAKARSYTPEQLLEQVKIDDLYFLATGGGVTFGGGEPLLHSDFIAAFHAIAPKEWTLNIETSLNVPKKNLLTVLPFINTLIADIKDLHEDIYRQYTGKELTPALENLLLAKEHLDPQNIRVRVPLIPDFNTPDHQLESAEKLRSMGFFNVDLFPYKTEINK